MNLRPLVARIFGPHCAYGELAQAAIEQVLAEEGHEYLPVTTCVRPAGPPVEIIGPGCSGIHPVWQRSYVRRLVA